MRMLDRFYATDDASDYIRIWILLCLELWLGSRRRVAGTAHVEAVPQMSGIA
jgi:hypothetical protein